MLHWTLLIHVHVSPLHRYYYTWHYYFLFMSHWYTDTLFHWIPLFWYICIIATWILCTQLYHVHTSLLHRFTGIHALIVSVFLSHGSLSILHELLHMYILVFPLHDCFPLKILIFSLLDMNTVDMRCRGLSAMWI